ncbi:hypothetical protein F0562_009339 [Nyssa sinensis]|uniref:Uncharacterized protein n=1 Tax=Nyssa sinensis TaxID=561372 RepID=A0A5J4ZYK4_9ASTE|nr:hypothetical protein F0562_009339 [Nyssa sinensis]
MDVHVQHIQGRSDYQSQRTIQLSPLLQITDSKTPSEPNEGGHNSLRTRPLPEKRWSIFRVAAHVREIDERAYKPRTVSIGPFHYRESGLEAMEAQKQRFLDRMLEQISGQGMNQESLVDAMKELEGKTRECYSEEFKDIQSDDFVRMVVVDGCFIVELLRLSDKYFKNELADDPIFATCAMPINLGRDLLMLENQLPLFVLQKLYNLTRPGGEGITSHDKLRRNQEAITSVNKLALKFFEPLRLGKDVIATENCDVASEYPHLLALFHSSFAPTTPHPPPTATTTTRNEKLTMYRTFVGKGWVHSAKSLANTGVRFRAKSGTGNVLDIEFKKEVLEFRTLFIDDSTTSVLRNLLVYEQYNRCALSYFSSLAVLLNNIVDKPDDVAMLKRYGIIWGQCGDEELVNFIKSLTKELMFDMVDFQFGELIQGLRKHTRSKGARLMFFIQSLPLLKIITSILLAYISVFQTLLLRNIPGTSPAPAPTSAPAPTP